MTRDERQDLSVAKFLKTGGCGTLEAVTAFGKTRVALRLIKHMRRKHPTRTVLVVVPTEPLRDQWLDVLKTWGLLDNTQVVIINTVIKNRYIVDFAVIDEIHRTGAESFQHVFDAVDYRFILGLTGTLKRADKRQHIITSRCPVFDRITLGMAKANGWVSQYLEINLGLDLPEDHQLWYDELEDKYNKCMDIFQWDFGLMADCAKPNKPKLVKDLKGNISFSDSAAAKYARSNGWTGNSAYQAYNLMSGGRRKNLWEGTTPHPYHPDYLNIMAINGIRYIGKIRDFINNHTSKLEAAIQIVSLFEKKTITFAESTAIADELTKRINLLHPFPFAKSYHSDIPPIIVGGKKLSKKATRAYILESFKINDCTFLNTAKMLDEGMDDVNIDQGIRIAGSSSARQQTQRRGRVIRLKEGKFALFWNIYLKRTKEVDWLKRAQNYAEDVLWADSVNEVKEILEEIDEREASTGVL
jgi:superfamily II DNA or RNA helicase